MAMLEEKTYTLQAEKRPQVCVDQKSPYRAVEEYAYSEGLPSVTLVAVEGVGEFSVTKIGEGYVALHR